MLVTVTQTSNLMMCQNKRWAFGVHLFSLPDGLSGPVLNNKRVNQYGYTTVDMIVANQTGADKVQLNLDNVFDEKYWLAGTGKGSGWHQINYGGALLSEQYFANTIVISP